MIENSEINVSNTPTKLVKKEYHTDSDFELVPNIQKITADIGVNLKNILTQTMIKNRPQATVLDQLENEKYIEKIFESEVINNLSYFDFNIGCSTFENISALIDKNNCYRDKFEIHDINEQNLSDFLNDSKFSNSSAIYVCSDTGTKKSLTTVEWAKKNLDKKCVIMVPRCTLATSYYVQLKNYGFKTHIYESNKTAQLFKYDRVIVVINSIYTLNINIIYDLVVIDEPISMYAQWPSTGNKLNQCVTNFECILKTCKKLIAMDAHINYLAIEPLMELTFMKPGDQSFIINNYNSGIDQNWYITSSDYDFMSEILHDCINEKRIIICLTTKSMVNAIKQFIEHVCPNRRIIEITGETPRLAKTSFIENLDTLIRDGYIIIYNTAVTVGVSTLEHVDCVYLFNNNQCVIQEFHYQQARRCRKNTKFIILFGYLNSRTLPKTKEALFKNIDNYLSTIIKDLPIPYSISYSWKIKMFKNCVALKLLITNILITNNSISSPNEKMLSLIKMTGANILPLKNIKKVPQLPLDFKMSDMKQTLKQIIAENIEHADQLNIETNADFADLLLKYRDMISTQ